VTGAPEQRREPVKTEDAVASFMRNTAARNWQEPTQRKFRTLLVDRLQFYTASKGYRYLNQMTLDVITEFRATDALLKLGILDGVMLCRPRQAGGQPAEGIFCRVIALLRAVVPTIIPQL